MPRVRDLTNSNYNNLGATPSSSGDHYQRHIGAGFFAEWGYMDYFTDVGFAYHDFWTSDVTDSNPFYVHSFNGDVSSFSANNSRYGACIAP
ncbi:hypothetical protein [Gilliamella sp. Imp1-1]|uniref:hypothetical protein n=1 Tax=Gilliamella sp. Imp1-1 TaxID=3120248 RepID=UPI0012D2A4B2|nr:hypothetical protein [Gilliamella apicola]